MRGSIGGAEGVETLAAGGGTMEGEPSMGKVSGRSIRGEDAGMLEIGEWVWVWSSERRAAAEAGGG